MSTKQQTPDKKVSGKRVESNGVRATINNLDTFGQTLAHRWGISSTDENRAGGKYDVDVLERLQSRFYTLDGLADRPEPEWLIDEVIPAEGYVGLIGKKSAMKTFTAIDLACHIASGIQWFDKKVAQGEVLYIYSEGANAASKRFDAWCKEHKVRRADIKLTVLDGHLLMDRTDNVAALVKAIEIVDAKRKEVGLVGFKPKFIVIDTLNRNIGGEEDDKGMKGVNRGCTTLTEEFGASVMVVHHTPKGDPTDARGHGSFTGALDTWLLVKRNRNEKRVTVKCATGRDVEDGWEKHYTVVKTGKSAALRENPTASASKGASKLPADERKILELVRDGVQSFTALLEASGLKRETFKRRLTKLCEKEKYLKKNADRTYSLTNRGRVVLGPEEPAAASVGEAGAPDLGKPRPGSLEPDPEEVFIFLMPPRKRRSRRARTNGHRSVS